MYIPLRRKPGQSKKKTRGKANRNRAKANAKNRRRINRMHGRRLSARLRK